MKLYRIGMGFAALQFVQAAIDLKVADALDDEPLGAGELGEDRRGGPGRARAAAARTVLPSKFFGAPSKDGRFRHTEAVADDRQDSPWGAPDVIRFGGCTSRSRCCTTPPTPYRTGEGGLLRSWAPRRQSYSSTTTPRPARYLQPGDDRQHHPAQQRPRPGGRAGPEPRRDGHGRGRRPGTSAAAAPGGVPRHPRCAPWSWSQVLPRRRRTAARGRCPGRTRASELIAGDCRESVPGGCGHLSGYKHKSVHGRRHRRQDPAEHRAGRGLRARVVVVDMLLGGDNARPEEICTAVDLADGAHGRRKRRSVIQFAALFEPGGPSYQGVRSIEGRPVGPGDRARAVRRAASGHTGHRGGDAVGIPPLTRAGRGAA
ncbi:hypothetical protein LT493_12010 [Streptomyces tricolor]|nr:hypothetical protein [Streptomyces tricolor]